ncbi:hypothetical protein [uncultured Sphingomonas sp.]|uniref:hypothetical protein n=1 Tax=uncultured Sphingomonas sp. TaxID=158754 RepID=UPI0025E1140F|nr:hypothetical protein [uncultured Sphingomonas sp.]
MNDTTAAPATSLIPDGVAAITTIHFVLIAIVAIAAIAMIVIGIGLKRRRTHAARRVEENAQEAGMAVREPDAAPIGEAALTEPKPAPAPTPAPSPAPTPVPAPVMPTPTAPEAPVVTDEPLNDEPVAAAAPMTASPAAEASAAPVDTARPEDQPITLLKGLGPKLTQKLAEHGITTVGDLAGLSDAQAQALDAQLGAFSGRMARDRWLEQARLLAAGDRAGFEAVFGRL